MEKSIKKAIESLAEKSKDASAIDSQQYAQAILNLSNALHSLEDTGSI